MSKQNLKLETIIFGIALMITVVAPFAYMPAQSGPYFDGIYAMNADREMSTALISVPENSLTYSSTSGSDEGDNAARVMQQDAANNHKVAIQMEQNNGNQTQVRVYDENGKLVMFQSWVGSFNKSEMTMTLPAKLTSGTFKAVIRQGDFTKTEILSL